MFLLLKIKAGMRRDTGPDYRHFEWLLSIPLLFASSMWLLFTTSVPAHIFPVQDAGPPRIQSFPETHRAGPSVEAAPDRLIIRSADHAEEYVLPRVPANDARFLHVPTGNARITERNGSLSLKPIGEGPIELALKTGPLTRALLATLLSWIILIVLGWRLRLFAEVR